MLTLFKWRRRPAGRLRADCLSLGIPAELLEPFDRLTGLLFGHRRYVAVRFLALGQIAFRKTVLRQQVVLLLRDLLNLLLELLLKLGQILAGPSRLLNAVVQILLQRGDARLAFGYGLGP